MSILMALSFPCQHDHTNPKRQNSEALLPRVTRVVECFFLGKTEISYLRNGALNPRTKRVPLGFQDLRVPTLTRSLRETTTSYTARNGLRSMGRHRSPQRWKQRNESQERLPQLGQVPR
ncbi:pleurotolysin a [Moniliophthora roreri]|nr:pleurotolysin a [Moniliophthora roreri]